MQAVANSAGPVVLYELNEVPWRLTDWYVRERPHCALAAVLRDAETFTSVTHDEGELQPWVTWPTLHRAVYNATHGIRYINQDLACADAWPPLWEKLARAGKRVGVFGSLQSYPPPSDHSYAFYIPDTFAPGPETLPERYSCFQRVNLRQTQADRAYAKPVDIDGSVAGDVLELLKNGLRLRTAARLAAQLVRERMDPLYRTRRAILQAPVAFDVFRHALSQETPDFCTFFTNHVAGIMHRYWKYAFPEDFGYTPRTREDAFHRETMRVALDDADVQIAFLKSWVDARGGRLYIASSMGQEAIHRGHEVELVIDSMPRFLRAIGFAKEVRPLAAMHPQYSFELEREGDARELAALVSAIKRADGTPAFYGTDLQSKTVSSGTGSGAGFETAEGARYIELGDGTRRTFEEAGLTLMQRDPGTGYHQPEGILIRYGAGVVADGARRRIESVEIAPMIMRDLGVDAGRASAPSRDSGAARPDHALA
jgi:hypothetical protein